MYRPSHLGIDFVVKNSLCVCCEHNKKTQIKEVKIWAYCFFGLSEVCWSALSPCWWQQTGWTERQLINTDFFGVDRREQYVGQKTLPNPDEHAKAPGPRTNTITWAYTPILKERQLVAGHLTSQVTCQHTFKQFALVQPLTEHLLLEKNAKEAFVWERSHIHPSSTPEACPVRAEFIVLHGNTWYKLFPMWVCRSSVW